MKTDDVLCKATFQPKVCNYWLLSGTIVLTVTIVGIPLLFLWLPLGLFFTRRYLERMECVLTPKALKVKKGILVRVEKTIPLEKITDMGMVQGPFMRHFDLHTLTVETAGQSGTGALVSLTGIVDAPGFRERVLAQRDVTPVRTNDAPPVEQVTMGGETNELLREIRDSLQRLENSLSASQKGDSQ